MSEDSVFGSLKQFLIGEPIPNHRSEHERLSKATGLAVFSSDGLSSVAYATEEILRTLLLAGSSALWLVTPLGAVIAGLLVVVTLSYRQTIQAYPGGGGAYVVARENLGVTPGLVAAAALLIDYVLTVAVSIAAGVAALTSALPSLGGRRLALCLLFLGVLAVANLRGVRESGRIFSIPTYAFLATLLLLIAAGAAQAVLRPRTPYADAALPAAAAAEPLTLFLVLRAFANGCTAMTGVEAVSNGVPVFRAPAQRNAAGALAISCALCVILFLGITFLAHAYAIVPAPDQTVVSQIARAVVGEGLAYYLIQATTLAILVLAANTAFSDFPRLASMLARDRCMPRQFMNQGDRLAFSNGILALSALAGLLLVAFAGDTHALMPLYMVGVFVSFTLSQAGMVVYWLRQGRPDWLRKAWISLVGGTLTAVVLVVVAVTKLAEGAWLVLALIPLLVAGFRAVHAHYRGVAAQLSLRQGSVPEGRSNTVLLPISGVHRAVLAALDYARSLGPDVRAVYVDAEPHATQDIRRQWAEWGRGIELVVLPSPYRSLLEPLTGYIAALAQQRPGDYVTVVLPEFVPARWWHHFLHNQRAWLIKAALLVQPRVVVTSVPFQLQP